MTTFSSTPTDASAHMAQLQNIWAQLQFGQHHVEWQHHQPISEADKQRRIRALTWGIYCSVPVTAMVLALMYIYVPDHRDTLPILVILMLLYNSFQVFWLLPWVTRQVQQQTHRKIHVQLDFQRKRVRIALRKNSQVLQTTKFHPSSLNIPTLAVLGVPTHATLEHTQLYRQVQSALRQRTGLVFE